MYEDIRKSNKKIIVILLLVFISVSVILFSRFVDEGILETFEQREERIALERNQFFISLTREQILEDFDYMMDVLEENYPFFDLIWRVYGVDMFEYASDLRIELADETIELDLDVFLQMMEDGFFEPSNFKGHLQMIDREYYLSRLSDALRMSDYPWLKFSYDIFTSYPAVNFYGEIDENDINSVRLRKNRCGC